MEKLSIDTKGGDTSILHLISVLDQGIKKRIQFKDNDRAHFYKKIHSYLKPIKWLVVFLYGSITQLEQPAFCVHLINKNLDSFNPKTCNTGDERFTNFNLLNKQPPAVTRPLEIILLLSLIAL